LTTLAVLHRAGVFILAGTDSPNPGTGHGVALHYELQILVATGFAPLEELEAATSLPAKIFNLGDRGTIAVGARADLDLVDGDPTAQIEYTLNILRIWKNGYSIARAAGPMIYAVARIILPYTEVRTLGASD
jgi:imidazolonepropionase-like amidohydrolase